METQTENMTTDNMNEQPLVFELGDIIQLESPSHEEFHQVVAYIDYIDNSQLCLIDTASSNKINLLLKEDGTLFEESICKPTPLIPAPIFRCE